jgi:hypothetical protein
MIETANRLVRRTRWAGVILLATLLAGSAGCEDDSYEPKPYKPTPRPTQKLEDSLQPVTTGVGESRAKPYPTANPSPAIVVNGYGFRSENLPAAWLAKTVEQTELVMAANSAWDQLDSEVYGMVPGSGGYTLIRRRNIVTIRVLKATTAEEIGSKVFKGPEPGGFPDKWNFDFSSHTDYLDGEAVSAQTIIDWLRQFVEHP